MNYHYEEIDELADCIDCGAEVHADQLDEYGRCRRCQKPWLKDGGIDLDIISDDNWANGTLDPDT